MSGKDWWREHGTFQLWKMCPTRPDPGEVLLFYLEKRGIEPAEQVAYLIDLLDLQKSMVYTILKGEGLDAISRCRQLVQALKIHPPLLGLDAKYYPIERHAYWWRSCGFSFNADAQGYPLMSEVVNYLRTRRTQISDAGRVKVWSQEDLGEATGLKKETIYRMEHNRNPLILESMSRRAIVASALGTLAGDEEPTLYRLFGLDPQAYGVPLPAHESIPEVQFSSKKLTDETLLGYQRKLGGLFAQYYTHHAEDTIAEAREWIRRLPTLLPLANTTAQRVHLLALQCRYHELCVGVAREQRKANLMTYHANKAVTLAEQAMTLPNLKLGHHTELLMTHELLAAALLWKAGGSYELGQYDQAQADIDRALSVLPEVQSTQLKAHILADAGLIHAHTVARETDRTRVLSHFQHAERLNTASQFRSNAPDDNFIRCGPGLLYLRKAMALSTPKMKGATAEKVSDLLDTAHHLTPPELVRQQTIIEVFQARVSFATASYELATQVALDALEKSQQIRSHLNRDRIEEFYQQLLNTSFRDKPLLAYLGMKLRTWDHGLD